MTSTASWVLAGTGKLVIWKLNFIKNDFLYPNEENQNRMSKLELELEEQQESNQQMLAKKSAVHFKQNLKLYC
jgi:hypothetical protein